MASGRSLMEPKTFLLILHSDCATQRPRETEVRLRFGYTYWHVSSKNRPLARNVCLRTPNANANDDSLSSDEDLSPPPSPSPMPIDFYGKPDSDETCLESGNSYLFDKLAKPAVLLVKERKNKKAFSFDEIRTRMIRNASERRMRHRKIKNVFQWERRPNFDIKIF